MKNNEDKKNKINYWPDLNKSNLKQNYLFFRYKKQLNQENNYYYFYCKYIIKNI